MKKLLFGLAALPFVAGIAMAGQPVALNDSQMDKVTAGTVEIIVSPPIPDGIRGLAPNTPAPNNIGSFNVPGASPYGILFVENPPIPGPTATPHIPPWGVTLSAI